VTSKIISHLEKKIQLLQNAVESLKDYDKEDRVLYELLQKEAQLDDAFFKRSLAARKAWERRRKNP
jgi:uncharacterized Fe-S cluster-containing protein